MRVVERGDGVRVSWFDTKYMYGGLNRTKDNEHATCFWTAKKCLGLCVNPVKHYAQVTQDHLCKEHRVNVSYKKAWMVKNILLELSLGNF